MAKNPHQGMIPLPKITTADIVKKILDAGLSLDHPVEESFTIDVQAVTAGMLQSIVEEMEGALPGKGSWPKAMPFSYSPVVNPMLGAPPSPIKAAEIPTHKKSPVYAYEDPPTPVVIYTDGSSTAPKHGGYGGAGFVAHVGGQLWVHARPLLKTTNQRAELTAALDALNFVSKLWPQPTSVEIYTDSNYVRHGMETWMLYWQLNNWTKKTGEAPTNLDLWKALHATGIWAQAEWRWVKGHSGVLGNEIADLLATTATQYAKTGIVPLGDAPVVLVERVSDMLTKAGHQEAFSAVGWVHSLPLST